MDAAAVEAVSKLEGPDGFPAAPQSSLPLREDQISNAVSFLTHPKVGSLCSQPGLDISRV